MLETEQGQRNAVFVCVGSALMHAQRYEQAVKFFIQTLRRQDPKWVEADDEAVVASVRNAMLGGLLKEFSKKVTLSDSAITSLLERAVKQRNFLAHHFFAGRENLLYDENGRMTLIAEAREMESVFDRAGQLMRAIGTVFEEHLDGTRKEPTNETLFTMEVAGLD